MARKFIQISTSITADDSFLVGLCLVGLCDDGTVWSSNDFKAWEPFGEAPQDGSPGQGEGKKLTPNSTDYMAAGRVICEWQIAVAAGETELDIYNWNLQRLNAIEKTPHCV